MTEAVPDQNVARNILQANVIHVNNSKPTVPHHVSYQEMQ